MALLWYFQIYIGHKHYHHHKNFHYAPNRLTLLTTITPRTVSPIKVQKILLYWHQSSCNYVSLPFVYCICILKTIKITTKKLSNMADH